MPLCSTLVVLPPANSILMACNSDVHSLGQSKTGIYRYSVYIFAVPIIMTVDHSAEWDSSEPWLAENVELIDLYEPCFES